MSDTDSTLEDVTGVGQTTAAALRERGIETIADLANAPITDVEDISGIGSTAAHDIIISAIEMAGGDGASEPFVIDDPDGDEFTLTISDEALPFVVHVLYEEGVSQHQSNNTPLRDQAFSAAEVFLCASNSTPGDTYTFVGSQQAITTIYRALSRGSSEYGSRRGISGMYGTLSAIAEDLNEYR